MKTKKIKKIIFTDLDGTLLNENYEWKTAEDALKKLKELDIPVIFCSAKTRAEQEKLRKEMEVNHPYIVEDGSAVVIPADSKLCRIIDRHEDIKRRINSKIGAEVEIYHDKNEVILKLGTDYSEIFEFLLKLKNSEEYKDCLKFYGIMDAEEIAEVTGLNRKMAELAKQREFSETLVSYSEEVLRRIKEKFAVVIGGRFVHVYGKGADKGKAVKILTELYTMLYRKPPVTFGIGNSYTDIPMLKAVVFPAIVKNTDGWIGIDDVPNVYKAEGVATAGWVEVVENLVLPCNRH